MSYTSELQQWPADQSFGGTAKDAAIDAARVLVDTPATSLTPAGPTSGLPGFTGLTDFESAVADIETPRPLVDSAALPDAFQALRV